MSRSVTVAKDLHLTGGVSLTMTVEGTQTVWYVASSEGGVFWKTPHANETDARREYDRRRRTVGAMA